jgi:excisionase family DNA binding protein
MDAQKLYDAREIAERLGLHLRTVQMLFHEGKIRGMKIGNRWKAYESDIQAYLTAQRRAAAVATGQEPL